jgi:biofilm PGA synthesis protein PgaA
MGIEPTSSAWEAEVLPLNYTRNAANCSGTGVDVEGGSAAGRSRPARSPRVRIPLRTMVFAGLMLTTLTALLPSTSHASDDREQAVLLARQGQQDEAIVRLQRLSQTSGDVRIRFDLIVVLGWARRHREAVDTWQTLAPNTPIPPYVKQELIRSLTETGHLDQAAQLAQAWVTMSPGDPAPLIATGQVAEHRGLRFDAIRAYGRAQALSPDRSDLYDTLARLLAELGGTHGAHDQLLHPRLPDRARRAATRLRWATQIPAEDPSKRNHPLDAVIAEFNALLAAARAEPTPDPQLLAQLLGDRAVALAAASRWQAALEDVSALRAARGSVPVYVRMAEAGALLGLRRPKEALAAYREVLDQSPGDLDARWGLFYALVETSDWQAAYQTVDTIAPEPGLRIGQATSLQGNPDWLYARIVGAQARSWADEHAPAWQRLNELADKAPAHAPLRAALASVAAARGWSRRADEEIRIAESLDDDDRSVQIEAAESALRRGRWSELQSRLGKLDDRYPDDASVRRLRREAALREQYELRIDVGIRDEGEEARAAPGDSLSASLRLYGPTWQDAWRIFAASDRMASSAPGMRASARHRTGMGAQYRTADTTVETALWHNSGPLEKNAVSVDLRHSASDHWSFTAGLSSFASDTPFRAVASGISASSAQGGLAYAWDELASLSLRLRVHDFSDGNRRQSSEASFSQRVYTAPEFKISLQPSIGMSSNTRPDGPYFSPARDHSISVAAVFERTVWQHYERSLTDRWALGGGRYWQAGFQSGPTVEASYEQTYRHGPTLELNYGVGFNRRPYDGASEMAKLFYLQMVSRFR